MISRHSYRVQAQFELGLRSGVTNRATLDPIRQVQKRCQVCDVLYSDFPLLILYLQALMCWEAMDRFQNMAGGGGGGDMGAQ